MVLFRSQGKTAGRGQAQALPTAALIRRADALLAKGERLLKKLGKAAVERVALLGLGW